MYSSKDSPDLIDSAGITQKPDITRNLGAFLDSFLPLSPMLKQSPQPVELTYEMFSLNSSFNTLKFLNQCVLGPCPVFMYNYTVMREARK